MRARTIPDIVAAARTRISREAWDHIRGGAEAEVTVTRNRRAFDAWALRPRVMRSVAHRDLSTIVLGQKLSMPVMLAPVGTVAMFDPGGALACARAGECAGTMAFVGIGSSPSLEEVRAGARGPLGFQLYVRGGRSWIERMVRRVEDAGYAAICVTVDTPTPPRLDRDIRNGVIPRDTQPDPNGLRDTGNSPAEAARLQASFDWTEFDWLRRATGLPIVLKGVLTVDDVPAALEHGVDVLYVSNHGGRALDSSPATMEVLPEIVTAAGGRAEVWVDGGFLRGTDVVKALALGAKATLIGRLMSFALAANGQAGVELALRLLREEIDTAMAALGVCSVSELGAQCLRPATPFNGPQRPHQPETM